MFVCGEQWRHVETLDERTLSIHGSQASNLSEVDRYAMPFFYGARDDAIVVPVPTTVSSESPSRYEPITYGDYQRWFLDRNYRGLTGQAAASTPP